MANLFMVRYTPTQHDYERITRSLLFRGFRTWLTLQLTPLGGSPIAIDVAP